MLRSSGSAMSQCVSLPVRVLRCGRYTIHPKAACSHATHHGSGLNCNVEIVWPLGIGKNRPDMMCIWARWEAPTLRGWKFGKLWQRRSRLPEIIRSQNTAWLCARKQNTGFGNCKRSHSRLRESNTGCSGPAGVRSSKQPDAERSTKCDVTGFGIGEDALDLLILELSCSFPAVL